MPCIVSRSLHSSLFIFHYCNISYFHKYKNGPFYVYLKIYCLCAQLGSRCRTKATPRCKDAERTGPSFRLPTSCLPCCRLSGALFPDTHAHTVRTQLRQHQLDNNKKCKRLKIILTDAVISAFAARGFVKQPKKSSQRRPAWERSRMSNVNVSKYFAFFADVSKFFLPRNICLNKDKQIGHSFILKKIPSLNICSVMQFQVEFCRPWHGMQVISSVLGGIMRLIDGKNSNLAITNIDRSYHGSNNCISR